MDDFDVFDRKLQTLIREIEKACLALDAKLHLNLKLIEVQRAIAEVMGAEDTNTLIELCPDSGTMIHLLQDYNFQKLRPELLETIDIEQDIIPINVPRIFEEQKIRLKGTIWVIHKNDADPFPSNPHAHNYEQNLKLDLSTGNLFRYKEQVGKIRKKHLIELRSLARNTTLPPLTLVGESKTD